MSLLDDAEQVDVGIVQGEVEGDKPGPPGQPYPFSQLSNDQLGIVPHKAELLNGPCSRISCQSTPMVRSVQLLDVLVAPSVVGAVLDVVLPKIRFVFDPPGISRVANFDHFLEVAGYDARVVPDPNLPQTRHAEQLVVVHDQSVTLGDWTWSLMLGMSRTGKVSPVLAIVVQMLPIYTVQDVVLHKVPEIRDLIDVLITGKQRLDDVCVQKHGLACSSPSH